MTRKSQVQKDLAAWRELARNHLPDWRPTLQGLQRLDEGPRELGVALRSIARGWDKEDARWDVLMAVLEYCKREHAHELANQQRALADANDELDHDHHRYVFSPSVREVADLIDPKAQRASTEGDTP